MYFLFWRAFWPIFKEGIFAPSHDMDSSKIITNHFTRKLAKLSGHEKPLSGGEGWSFSTRNLAKTPKPNGWGRASTTFWSSLWRSNKHAALFLACNTITKEDRQGAEERNGGAVVGYAETFHGLRMREMLSRSEDQVGHGNKKHTVQSPKNISTIDGVTSFSENDVCRNAADTAGGNTKFDAHSLSTVLGASRRALRFGHLLEVQMPSQQVRLDL